MYSLNGNLEAECIRLRELADQLELLATGCLPLPTASIDQWELCASAAHCLIGTAVRHPKLPTGRRIITSQLMFLSEDMGLARTHTRWYHLGSKAARSND